MSAFPLVFTLCFMLLGPFRLIPAYSGLTQGADQRFKRELAVWSAVIASALCTFVALAGVTMVSNFRISLDAVRIAGGLVMLLSALRDIFRRGMPLRPFRGTPTVLQLSASTVAVPMIVPPAGIAAILILMMLAPEYPGMEQVLAINLAIVMTLDFLVMYFIDRVMKAPGLMLVLTVLGAILVVVQASLAVQLMLTALESLGLMGADASAG